MYAYSVYVGICVSEFVTVYLCVCMYFVLVTLGLIICEFFICLICASDWTSNYIFLLKAECPRHIP